MSTMPESQDYTITDFSGLLPPMLFGEDLRSALAVLPEYKDSIRDMDAGRRLLGLSDIYGIFIPTGMAYEIYHRLYSMVSISMKKKGTAESVRLLNNVHRGVKADEADSPASGGYKGVATGMTSTTCIGVSGIGKTTCLQAAAGLCGDIIETGEPYRKLIPVIEVSCPFNCSFRSLCSQILARLDECLGTDYYQKSLKRTMNAEQVMQMVCNLANIHIGVLVIDEIQMIVVSKSGSQLYRMILQLINSSNICVLMCGTPECIPFFGQNPQMARRTVGLQYGPMAYDKDFKEFCSILFSYQYVRKQSEMSDDILEWLYEHSGAIPGTVMALIHDAQEIAILSGKEELCIGTLNEAYNRRLQMLHPYISPDIKKDKRYAPVRNRDKEYSKMESDEKDIHISIDFPSLVESAKKQGQDTAAVLGRYIPVKEIEL